MQPKNVLFAFVLAVVLSSTYAKKHEHKSDDQDSHEAHNHEEPSKQGHQDHSNEKHHFVKRQSDPPAPDSPAPDSPAPDSPAPDSPAPDSPAPDSPAPDSPAPDSPAPDSPDPSAPPQPPPPVPIADLHLDVGQVKVESITDSCNGVLLEPTFVLTSATCVFPNHTAEPYANITFTLAKQTKPVIKVFRNPYWRLTGERKENFALLQLEQPMPHVNQKYLISMTWSSYALEDLGDSYVADPDPTSCNTASNTARSGDVIRHMNDQLITLTCSNKGAFDAGSPIFRIVNGAPVIYGVFFGHCTTGSLDRSLSGSCGARISKQVFLDFCGQAKAQNVELTSCNSELLDQTHENFPTTVFSREDYDAMTERNHNPKSVVVAYHSSASEYYQSFVEDMETIQRLKPVYDKFQIAVVDVNILAFQMKAVPFIEYRTKSSEAYIPYNDEYDFTKFRNFMDVFGKVGAPPSGSTTFLQNLQLEKRSDVPASSGSASQETVLTVKSSSISGSAGGKFVGSSSCDATAGYYLVQDKKCACLPTHFGSGATCEALKTVLQDHCTYRIGSTDKTYNTIVTEAGGSTWCNTVKGIQVTVSGASPPSGLTPDHCADAIVELVACSFSNDLQMVQDNSPNATEERSDINKRSPVNTKNGAPPASYLQNFEGNTPPGPITHAPNTHYYTVEGEGASPSETPYSVLFDGNRGIPVLVGYKVSNANMKGILNTKSWLRNRWTKLTQNYARMGSNKIYLGRNNRTFPEAVEEGQLNPNQMHSYDDSSMDLTFNHINAFPQLSDFADGVWRKYQDKIISYAKDRCSAKDASAVFHVVSGLSDYELTGTRSSAFLKQATYWPVAYVGAVQPHHSPILEDGVSKSIVRPKSAWTVGCCTWTASGKALAEAVSFWANNKPRGIPKHEIQSDLHTIGSRLFPGKPCFQFFPANAQCNIVDNHFTLAP